MPIKDQYSELLKMTSPCEKLIRRDMARTYPEHDFFKEKDSLGQEVLFNVMKVSQYFSPENTLARMCTKVWKIIFLVYRELASVTCA